MGRRRQARVKPKPVPPSDLGFRQPSSSQDDAWENYSLSQRDISIVHFENRQEKRAYETVIIPLKLQRGKEWKCILEDWIEGTYKKMTPDLEECLRSRTMSKATISSRDHNRPLSNPLLFVRELEMLKKRLSKVHPPIWFRDSVQLQLGPEHIQIVLQGNLKKVNIRKCELLIYNHNYSAILFAEAGEDVQQQKRQIKNYLQHKSETPEKFFLSAPSSGFAMSIEYGKEPTFISEPCQSHFAIFAENERVFGKRKLDYENRLGCRIRRTKLLTTPEKTWLEKMNGGSIVPNRMRIIEFYTAEERNKHAGSLGALDILYCETMYNHEETYEDVFLSIEYDTRPKYVEGVCVHLTYEADKAFAENVFRDHGLMVVYFNHAGVKDPDAKYDHTVTSFVIQYFPKHYRTLEDRVWFIEQVCEANLISISRTEQHIEFCPMARETARDAKRLNLRSVINYDIYKSAHKTGVYRPIDTEWDSTRGSRGARHFFRVVMERPDVPWSVERMTTDEQAEKNEENFQVFFKNSEIGCRVINAILDTYYQEPIFRCDTSDLHGPKLQPVFRIRQPISRAMRNAFHDRIISLDTQLRRTFTDYSTNRDRLMCLDESQFFAARIFESWHADEQIGFIGVEGWNEHAVRHFFASLQRALRPIEFRATDEHLELLCGVGEVYVHSLADKYHHEVLVDIDKFRQIISVFGDGARKLVEKLKAYAIMKASIEVTADIPLFFPFNNTLLRTHLSDRSLSQLFVNLSSKCRCEFDNENQCIKFNGTVESYELMTRAVAELSSEIFERFTSMRKERMILQCPGCITETGITGDVIRCSCGHVMCRACVNLMVQSRINEPQVRIQCAVDGCETFLTPNEIETIILGDSRRIRELDASKLMRLTARAKQALVNNSNGTIKSCTTPDCVGIFHKTAGPLDVAKKCATCQRPYCRACLSAVHTGETCEEHALLQIPDASIAAFVRKTGRNHVKMCPRCNIWVIKSEGCNHIECKCGSHFCWVCLYLAKDSKDCYEHMSTEHRGFGGGWRIENNRVMNDPDEVDGELNIDMQRMMLAEHDLAHQRPVPAANINQEDDFVAPVPVELFQHVTEFPRVLLAAFPNFYGDLNVQDMLLVWLNDSETAEEVNWKIRQLFQWPLNA